VDPIRRNRRGRNFRISSSRQERNPVAIPRPLRPWPIWQPLFKAPVKRRNPRTPAPQLLRDGRGRGRVRVSHRQGAKSGPRGVGAFRIAHLMPRPRGRAIALDLARRAPGLGANRSDVQRARWWSMAHGPRSPRTRPLGGPITRTFDGRLNTLKAYEMERPLSRGEPGPGRRGVARRRKRRSRLRKEQAPNHRTYRRLSAWGLRQVLRGQGEGTAPCKTPASGDSRHHRPS